MEGDFPLCWAQMVACSSEEAVQDEEVGQAVHQQVAALVCRRVGFKRFTIPLGVKTPTVLVFHDDWSLKDPLLLFVAVVRYAAVMSWFSMFAVFVMLSWQC